MPRNDCAPQVARAPSLGPPGGLATPLLASPRAPNSQLPAADPAPVKVRGMSATSQFSDGNLDILLEGPFDESYMVGPQEEGGFADSLLSDYDGDALSPIGGEGVSRVTHEDVEQLRDFTHELKDTAYFKDYANWRKGDHRGAKGEAADAVASAAEDSDDARDVLVQPVKSARELLAYPPGEVTLIVEDDMGQVPLRAKPKRLRFVDAEAPDAYSADGAGACERDAEGRFRAKRRVEGTAGPGGAGIAGLGPRPVSPLESLEPLDPVHPVHRVHPTPSPPPAPFPALPVFHGGAANPWPPLYPGLVPFGAIGVPPLPGFDVGYHAGLLAAPHAPPPFLAGPAPDPARPAAPVGRRAPAHFYDAGRAFAAPGAFAGVVVRGPAAPAPAGPPNARAGGGGGGGGRGGRGGRRTAGKTCKTEGCEKKAVSQGLCVRHGGGRRCAREQCMNIAASRSAFCKTHGGGRRCRHAGCDKSAAVPTDFCKRHGGGKRCIAEGCDKSAQGSTNFCKGHGGGRRCKFEGCVKSAADSTDFCKRHGGGVRCTYPGCERAGADGRTLCKRHGGGRRCFVEGCDKSAQGVSGLCRRHWPAKGAQPAAVLPAQQPQRASH